jgi:hypothetical protein
MTVVLGFAAVAADRVSVVEAHEALTVRAMQGQRIIEAVWFFRRYRNARYDESDPILTRRVHHQNLTIKV